MKKKINLTTIAASLLLIAFSASCATFATPLLIPLQERTLLLDIDKPGQLFYSWRECKKRVIWCTEWEQKREYYNLNDKDTTEKLLFMGFKVRVLD